MIEAGTKRASAAAVPAPTAIIVQQTNGITGLREEVKTLSWARLFGSGSRAGSVLRTPYRNHPEAVPVEPFQDDRHVIGKAMPLVGKWPV